MATQVLRPHDILEGPIPSLAPRRKHGPKPQRRPPAPSRPEARRQQQQQQRERSPKPAKAADAGKAAILKGGKAPPRAAAAVSAAEVYAGSGFSNSPSPSALPLPSFSLKKDVPAVGEYLATMALRRMLRLE